MLNDALESLRDIFTPPFRSVLLKSLGLTLALLALFWIGVEGVLQTFLTSQDTWVNAILSVLAGVGLIVGLGFLVAPVTTLIAGLFLDDIAETVETTRFAGDPMGRAMPLGRSLIITLRFTGIVILGNLFALALLLVPGVNVIAFFVVNAYLISREYFEAAAMRYRPPEEARAMRRANAPKVFVAGLLIAALLAVPILNLVTPLFATALMVRLHKALSAGDPRVVRIGYTPGA